MVNPKLQVGEIIQISDNSMFLVVSIDKDIYRMLVLKGPNWCSDKKGLINFDIKTFDSSIKYLSKDLNCNNSNFNQEWIKLLYGDI